MALLLGLVVGAQAESCNSAMRSAREYLRGNPSVTATDVKFAVYGGALRVVESAGQGRETPHGTVVCIPCDNGSIYVVENGGKVKSLGSGCPCGR